LASIFISLLSWNGWAFKTNNPLVVTEHTAIHDSSINIYRTPAQGIYYKIIKKNEARSLESADYVTCVSQYTQKILEQTFDYTDSHVIPNGVDTNIFRPYCSEGEFQDVDHNKTIILFMGNLTRLKGADLLLQIMDLLGDRYTLLVTSGFKHNVDRFQKNIVNIGMLDQKSLVNAYNLCDIFLLPSRLEGMSLSTLEAMACAKPVVAFNCSSFPELVVDGKGGFLLEKEDVNGIVERIRYLAQEPDLIRRENIFCFEPSKATFDLLKKNLSNYKRSSINFYNFGFSDINGIVTLYTNNENSGLGSVYKRRLDHFNITMNNEEQVTVKTLDSFCIHNGISRIDLG